MHKYWITHSPLKDSSSYGDYNMHESLKEAKEHAKARAKECPGVMFIILEAIDAYQTKEPIVVQQMLD